MDTYYVWRRGDGYINATAYRPQPDCFGPFEILLETKDWPEARDLIEAERKAAGQPAHGRIWESEGSEDHEVR